MLSMFSEGGYMMWVILIVDLMLLLLASVALIASFTKSRSVIIQVVSIVASAFPTIIGLIAYKMGLASLEAATAQAVEVSTALIEEGRAIAGIPLKFGLISTVVLLVISIAAFLVKKSRIRKEEELVDYV